MNNTWIKGLTVLLVLCLGLIAAACKNDKNGEAVTTTVATTVSSSDTSENGQDGTTSADEFGTLSPEDALKDPAQKDIFS